MSVFVKRKLKDGRRIRSRYGYDNNKVLISRRDFEGLLNDSDVAYEQAKQLQTIIENLEEIKAEAVRKALDKIRAEIIDTLYVDSLIFGELIGYREGRIRTDDVIEEFNRVTKAEVLKIIDTYRESEGEE